MEIIAPVYQKRWYNYLIYEDVSSDYGTNPTEQSDEKERLKLDVILQKLFKLSDQVTLHLINALFDECFLLDEVSIHYDDKHLINYAYDRIIGDLFVALKVKDKNLNYHVEFQTSNDSLMVIRMFHYGFEKALEIASHNKVEKRMIISFPKQLVIFLEENKSIEDELSFTLQLPDGPEMDYRVPVVKLWEYSAKDLVNNNMHALLPLQVFQLRKKMKAIHQSKRSKEEKSKLMIEQFKQLERTIEQITKTLKELNQDHLTDQELDGILSALRNLVSYLYNHYEEYKTIEEEVRYMIESVITPQLLEKVRKKVHEEVRKEVHEEVREEERKKFARLLLAEGFQVEKVAKLTDLSVEEVQKLQE